MFRRDSFRFSLRLLLAVLTGVAGVLAVLHNRAERQRNVVRLVKTLGGTAAYEYQRDPAIRRMPHLTDDYFCPITQVVLNDTRASDSDLAKLTALPRLRVLLLQNSAITDNAIGCFGSWDNLEWIDLKGTTISDEGAEKLRRRFPNAEVETHWGHGCS